MIFLSITMTYKIVRINGTPCKEGVGIIYWMNEWMGVLCILNPTKTLLILGSLLKINNGRMYCAILKNAPRIRHRKRYIKFQNINCYKNSRLSNYIRIFLWFFLQYNFLSNHFLHLVCANFRTFCVDMFNSSSFLWSAEVAASVCELMNIL